MIRSRYHAQDLGEPFDSELSAELLGQAAALEYATQSKRPKLKVYYNIIKLKLNDFPSRIQKTIIVKSNHFL